MAVTPLPVLSRLDPAFKAKTDTFFGSQLPTFTSEVNAELARVGNIAFGSYNATSTSSVTIGTGAKTLAVETGKGFVPGQALIIARTADPVNYMSGQVTSYDAGTGALVLNVGTSAGSGTYTGWTISVTALVGVAPTTGVVVFVAANTPPSGYLKANGALISRTTYAELFAVVGVTFGVGDGSTTFKLPDLRGEFIRGWDDARGIDTGRVIGSSQAEEFKSHTHQLGTTGGGPVGGTGGYYGSGGVNTTSAGGAETRPRNIALLACIKY